MNRVRLLCVASPGTVAALIVASVLLGALLAFLMMALFAEPELDEIEEMSE